MTSTNNKKTNKKTADQAKEEGGAADLGNDDTAANAGTSNSGSKKRKSSGGSKSPSKRGVRNPPSLYSAEVVAQAKRRSPRSKDTSAAKELVTEEVGEFGNGRGPEGHHFVDSAATAAKRAQCDAFCRDRETGISELQNDMAESTNRYERARWQQVLEVTGM